MAGPNFRTGADTMRDEAASAGFSGGGQRLPFFQLAEGKHQVIRFLSDGCDRPELEEAGLSLGWTTVQQHCYLPTMNPAPAGLKGNWPASVSLVCRNDKAFKDVEGFGDCWVCKNLDALKSRGAKAPQAKARGWALALLREEVIRDGKVVGHRTAMREVPVLGPDGKPTDKMTQEPAIVVINQPYNTFFCHYDHFFGYFCTQRWDGQEDNTVLDQDFRVERKGKEIDTDYPGIPLGRVKMSPDSDVIFDIRNPEIAKLFKPPITLGEIITNQASAALYARFFPTGDEITDTKADLGTGAVPPPEVASKEEQEERLRRMREQITPYSAGSVQVPAN